MRIEDSTLRRNPSGEFQNYPGIFYLGNGNPVFVRSTVEN
jgi:hypothetical protein